MQVGMCGIQKKKISKISRFDLENGGKDQKIFFPMSEKHDDL